jgi:hypothetical protein
MLLTHQRHDSLALFCHGGLQITQGHGLGLALVHPAFDVALDPFGQGVQVISVQRRCRLHAETQAHAHSVGPSVGA